MKIAQIVCSFPPYKGGIGNSAWRLAKLLENDSVTTFTPRYNQKNTNSELTAKYLPALFKLGQAAILPGLFFKLKKFSTIIFHYPFFGTAEVLWFYRLFHRQQTLMVFYHMDVSSFSLLYKILSWPGRLAGKSLLNQADHIVCSSLDYIKHSQIAKLYEKSPDKFREIPFAIDTDKFTPLDKSNETKKLLFVGGLDKAHYFKGVDILIIACSQLKSNNWHLTIVGDGKLKTGYQALTKKLYLEKKIKFTGKLSDNELKQTYQKSDVLILPSINQNEAFGLVILEALASGLAIIASNLPGVRSVFNSQTGLTAKPKNSQDLATKINQLISNGPKLKNLQLAARQLAKEKYNLQTARESWKKLIYEDRSN